MYPGLLLIPYNLICHMTMFTKLNFDPSPRLQGLGTKKIVSVYVQCAIHVKKTHTPNLVDFGFFFLDQPPPPPRYPKVPPLGMTQAAKGKSRLICYISFICEKISKVWFKFRWCNSDLMIFNLLAPPQGPRGRGPKNGAVAYAIHVSNTHTKSG